MKVVRLKGFVSDQFTYTSLLNLSASQGTADIGKQIHACIIRNLARPSIVLETEPVHMYSQRGRLIYAEEIFMRMRERNAHSWNSMNKDFEQNNRAIDTLNLVEQNDVQMLIYEHIPNGSVSTHLYGASKVLGEKLEFKHSLLIAHGAAKGLSHLHSLNPPMGLSLEFEPLIQKPYTIVYFHSAASLQVSRMDEAITTNPWSKAPAESSCNICSLSYFRAEGCHLCSTAFGRWTGMAESSIR